MKNNAEEKRIQELAKHYLKIPKEFRLLNKDGYAEIPAVPSLFYINELTDWLIFGPEFAGRNSVIKRDKDLVMESVTYRPVNTVKLDFSLNERPPGVYPVKKNNIEHIALFVPLTFEDLSNGFFPVDVINQKSFSHYKFLTILLSEAYNNHNLFMNCLAEKMKMPLREDFFFQDAIYCLRKTQMALLDIEEKGNYNIIPMLYGLRDHGFLMCWNPGEIEKYEVAEWGLLYSYGFSQNTSQAFLMHLKKYISNLINRYEQLMMKQSLPTNENYKTSISKGLPLKQQNSTKERVKAILELLRLNENDEDEDSEMRGNQKSKLNSLQFRLMLKCLEKTGVINKQTKKHELGIAYSILSGYTFSYFDKYYQTTNITDIGELKKFMKSFDKKQTDLEIKELKSLITEDLLRELDVIHSLVK